MDWMTTHLAIEFTKIYRQHMQQIIHHSLQKGPDICEAIFARWFLPILLATTTKIFLLRNITYVPFISFD